MVTATKNIITKEKLERYLPSPLRRSGREYRTWLEASQSKTHISINFEEQVYYDFHYNQGGSLVSLMRQLGVPIPHDIVESNPRLTYKKQLSMLARHKSEGRYFGCGTRTAIKTNLRTGFAQRAERVMCLKWNCPTCAPFLKRVWMEHLADYHFGAIYQIPKGYKGIGAALNRIKSRAKRQGGPFEWLLLQSNEIQVLLVDSRSLPEVKQWLDSEPFFELVALNPTYSERTKWLDVGLEQMNDASNWNHKVRHSRGIASIKANVDNVNNTRREYITLSTQECWDLEMVKMQLVEVVMQGKRQVEVDKDLGLKKARAWLVERRGEQLEPYGVFELQMYEDGATLLLCDATVDKASFPSGQWDIVAKTLQEVVTDLESQGYTADWLTEHIVCFIPPGGGSP